MLKLTTTITEVLMLLYWVLAAALVFNFINIDPSLMYSDYENPLVVAWNWSFFPIDIAFASIGLFSKYGNVIGDRKFKLEISASVLMICAGLMTISYWIITGDFSPTWWAVNIWLIILGSLNLYTAKAGKNIS